MPDLLNNNQPKSNYNNVGFGTLALQNSSSTVWKVLGNVKKVIENFGGLLEKDEKNIQTGLGQLNEGKGKRTRAINRELREVERMPVVEGANTPEIKVELGGIELGTQNAE